MKLSDIKPDALFCGLLFGHVIYGFVADQSPVISWPFVAGAFAVSGIIEIIQFFSSDDDK